MRKNTAVLIFALILGSTMAKAQSSAEELAKKLANPVASLISVPFQNNLDVGIGPLEGYRNTLNFQPVIPVSISKKWNLISRVILPIMSQRNITGEGQSQSGLGDIVASAFFAPSESKNGLTWGVGPVLLVPTATNDYLGGKKFGVGPTALVLKQIKGWTIGALANQIWSIAGDKNRQDISAMFVQPFLNYNWKSGAGLGGNLEITQNWKADNTTIFFNPTVSGVTKLGTQTISMAIGPRIPLTAPNGSKPNFGVRAVVVLVFPK